MGGRALGTRPPDPPMYCLHVGFYTPAEFEKYIRYLDNPRKRPYESTDRDQAQSSPRSLTTSNAVLLKKRRAKQATEEGMCITYSSKHRNKITTVL